MLVVGNDRHDTKHHGNKQDVYEKFYYEIQAEHADEHKGERVCEGICGGIADQQVVVKEKKSRCKQSRVDQRAGDCRQKNGHGVVLAAEQLVDGSRAEAGENALENADGDRDNGRHLQHLRTHHTGGTGDDLNTDGHAEHAAEQRTDRRSVEDRTQHNGHERQGDGEGPERDRDEKLEQ